jgi:hypothetical protein
LRSSLARIASLTALLMSSRSIVVHPLASLEAALLEAMILAILALLI